MKKVATVLLVAWAVLVLPVWLLGMAFAGELRFIPDWQGTFDFWLKVATMYIPPLLFVAAKLIETVAPANREVHAQD